MSDVVSVPEYRPREIRQAICGNCGKVVSVRVSDSRSREIRLWWPAPLAIILWLAIIWKFGDFLSSPNVEKGASAPIEASFVELPEVVPSKSPQVQSKPLPKHASKPKIKPRSDVSPRTETAAARSETQSDPAPAPNLAPPADLTAYINAARERRRAAETSAEREYAAAKANEHVPSADEIRMANVMRNLQPQGTNGVFQIISVGIRTGKFSFRGWTKDFSNSRRELIEVEADPNGDIERAIVRRMIELIRKYYKGDFNWDSQRLNRVVIMSARVEDNAGLEDFLMREFFGAASGPR
ncbi:hypothetical protein SCT_1621 [Sulfuricella sp. T08]|uniref:hypothetical protein n=1 Tax=Sulfuricella sp. T08 TaxID=1632857 RepID=UPI0006179A68|nr:hypothetical protein [Sulfuricella sp. T08]GAO36219.1 hypothetical protein SCT_1621 [Sulfuricella sp. T08]